MPRRCPECEFATPWQRPSAPRSRGGRMLAADVCASSSSNPACCFCGVWAPGGPREWRSLCSGSHSFGHAHLAEMSKSSARISMRETEYSPTLCRPCRRSSRGLSHCSSRKSIADSVRTRPSSTSRTAMVQIAQFCLVAGVTAPAGSGSQG